MTQTADTEEITLPNGSRVTNVNLNLTNTLRTDLQLFWGGFYVTLGVAAAAVITIAIGKLTGIIIQ